jgi:hypothetical protein
MALTKVTKHILHGSALVQYKYGTITGNATSANDTQVGSAVTITPQYADSILENTFSGDMNNDTNGDNHHFRVSLYVNGQKEYEQTELLGGPRGGHQATHHGGNSNRIYANHYYSHLKNMRQSVGLTHAFAPGSTNAQACTIHVACYENGGKNLAIENGFLIVKEMSMGITSLSGPQ